MPRPYSTAPPLRFPLLVIVLLIGVAGCGSDGGTGPGDGDGDDRMVLADPSFSQDIQEIFNRRGCTASNCHGAAESAGLDLRPAASHAELVGVPATSEPFLRVAPGDPDDSYLMIKLEGRQSVGARMPLAGPPLDEIDLTNIRNWIQQGAENN